MEQHAGLRPSVGRFMSLLANEARPRPIYDEILLETHGCVVPPTLGSILPKWLLVIPRTPAINFARWQASTGVQPHDLVRVILSKHRISDDRVIWFEHGPSEVGSSIACGVDQAHLHVIVDPPFSFQEFVFWAMKVGQLTLTNWSVKEAYRSVEPEVSYLLAASSGRAVVAQNVESAGSQFFRRVIADLIQQPDCWNYRIHPHLDNVHQTIREFGVKSCETERSERAA
jgi:ATP adenylyltransferase